MVRIIYCDSCKLCSDDSGFNRLFKFCPMCKAPIDQDFIDKQWMTDGGKC